jgi:catechol 2,3-dioxygenase-like lactoylglutathione lyase family enzyme
MRYLIPLLLATSALGQQRPPITGIATFAIKVGDLTEARNFYSNVLGYDEIFVSKITGASVFKVNDHQYVEISATLKGDEDRLSFIGLETTDARKLAAYLASKGVNAPAALKPDADGNLSFTVTDPDNHEVRFVQYLAGSAHSRLFGQHLSPRRTSEHIIHVGVHIHDRVASDRFYVDLLGCRFMWAGGPNENQPSWISVMLPEGTDWIEYMASPPNPNPRQLGGNHHMALGVPEIRTPYQAILDRGYKAPQKPILARDGRWLLNIYDPNFTRAEFMVRKPVVTPCCSELHDPTIPSGKRIADLYFVDVEESKAVLVVMPDRKAMLLNPKPDQYSDRVLAVIKQAGIETSPEALVPGDAGVVMTFGKFRLVDAGEGLFLLSQQDSKPKVAILSTGYDHVFPYQTVRSRQGLEDIWELNYQAPGGKDGNAPEPFIANHDQSNCPGRWIKVSAEEDGAFTVTNIGNGLSKRYPAK